MKLNRSDAANALNQHHADEFGLALQLAEADQSCHVVVLAGHGRFFCGGGDVAAMAQAPDCAEFVPRLRTRFLRGHGRWREDLQLF